MTPHHGDGLLSSRSLAQVVARSSAVGSSLVIDGTGDLALVTDPPEVGLLAGSCAGASLTSMDALGMQPDLLSRSRQFLTLPSSSRADVPRKVGPADTSETTV